MQEIRAKHGKAAIMRRPAERGKPAAATGTVRRARDRGRPDSTACDC